MPNFFRNILCVDIVDQLGFTKCFTIISFVARSNSLNNINIPIAT
jgi:hypothetical protein